MSTENLSEDRLRELLELAEKYSASQLYRTGSKHPSDCCCVQCDYHSATRPRITATLVEELLSLRATPKMTLADTTDEGLTVLVASLWGGTAVDVSIPAQGVIELASEVMSLRAELAAARLDSKRLDALGEAVYSDDYGNLQLDVPGGELRPLGDALIAQEDERG